VKEGFSVFHVLILIIVFVMWIAPYWICYQWGKAVGRREERANK
jgi:hypothetical protein